jgi:hypothetical protein
MAMDKLATRVKPALSGGTVTSWLAVVRVLMLNACGLRMKRRAETAVETSEIQPKINEPQPVSIETAQLLDQTAQIQ